MNNTHCEGVANKLEQKVRNWLKIINRTYVCSEGLENVQNSLSQKKAQLYDMEKTLDALKVGELEVYRKHYEMTVDEVNKDMVNIRAFTVGILWNR